MVRIISIVHFNYEWNTANQYRNLDRLKGVKVQYAYVEQQSDALKASIKAAPTIIIYKDGRPVAKFEAGSKNENRGNIRRNTRGNK